VLERDAKLVDEGSREDLMSHDIARDIYKVVYDEKTRSSTKPPTQKLRADYRKEAHQSAASRSTLSARSG